VPDWLLTFQSCELYDPVVNQWTVVVDRCLSVCSSCAPSIVFHQTVHLHGAETKLPRLALFGGHSFENDSDHSLLQIVEFTRDKEVPVADCIVTNLVTRGISYFTTNVLKLPSRYVSRFH
jgi:hypothetical protein